MRLPLAVKVMLAFVAVIAAGVIPIQFAVRSRVQQASRQHAFDDLRTRAQLVADRLAGTSETLLVSTVLAMAHGMTERVTVVAADGTVLMDTAASARDMENHLGRPEVMDALQGAVGADARTSQTDGRSYVYVAVPVATAQGHRVVLRLAAAEEGAEHLALAVTAVIEQGTALAVSLALLLSFAAVVSIVRPLRRMRDAANRLAGGEFTVRVDVDTGDELAELARSLEAVGAQLRSRLAAAGSGEALVGQMVHAMVQGVVMMGADGHVMHVNGVARAKLGLRGPRESERLTHLLESPVVRAAMVEATGDPLGVDIRVPHPVTGELIDGVVVALRRPHGDPMHALLLDVTQGDAPTLLEIPDLNDVVSVPFRELMDRALSRVHEDMEDTNAAFTPPDEWPASNVVDAGGRVESAVTETLRAAARNPGQGRTPLVAAVHEHAVCLRMAASVPADLVATLQPRLGPLGGRVASQNGSVELWLPVA